VELLRSSSDRDKWDAANVMFQCAQRKGLMNAMANLNGIMMFVEAVEESKDDAFRCHVMSVLSEIAVFNAQLCPVLGCSSRFVNLIRASVRNPRSSNTFVDLVVVSVTCIVSSSWSCHKSMLSLIDDIAHVLADKDYKATKIVRADCVRFFNNMSANKDNRPYMQGVIGLLVAIMKTGDLELASTSACCAVANLLGDGEARPDWILKKRDPSTEDIRPPPRSLSVHQHPSRIFATAAEEDIMDDDLAPVLVQLVDAFRATLQGEDFPRYSRIYYHSGKLCEALSKLCVYAPLKVRLIESDLLDLVAIYLERWNPRDASGGETEPARVASDTRSSAEELPRRRDHFQLYAMQMLWGMCQ